MTDPVIFGFVFTTIALVLLAGITMLGIRSSNRHWETDRERREAEDHARYLNGDRR